MKLSATFRLPLVCVLAALIGIAAGFIAFLLYNLIALLSNLWFFQRFSFVFPKLQLNQLGPLVIVIPAVGGLIVGVMAKYGTSQIKGHGIPEVMEAVLTKRSRIQPRVAILKPISAAIAIGTGGPFGAEGPIIQTGGAFGSLIGQSIRTTAAERKVLLACGAAAGMAATFSTPVAAVILAIELLLFEFKSRSFIPLVIASALATSARWVLISPNPLFSIAPVDFGVPGQLPYYLIIGVLCGVAAAGFSKLLYWVEDQFERLPFDAMWWPAIGGLAVGLIGFFVPRVFGVGYDTIADILNNQLPLGLLLGIMIFKAIALVISLGSGTSGGLLAPMFMSGAAMGGAFALLINALIPGAHLAPGAFALVAMAAVFGTASRATFTFIIFAFEITHDYNAILPLMLTCAIAEGVGLVLMRNSIMTEKLARRGLRVHQEYEVNVFQQTLVESVMDDKPVTVPGSIKLAELAEAIGHNDPLLTRHQALPIVDDENHLVGIITRGDILRALDQDKRGDLTALDAGCTKLVVTYPDETLHDALFKMLQHNIGRLPVVNRQSPSQLVGYLGRAQVIAAGYRGIHEETVQESGWFKRWPIWS